MGIKKLYDTLMEWFQEALLGFGTSVSVSFLWTEFVHIIAVVIGGIFSTVAIHYMNKLLKKYDK